MKIPERADELLDEEESLFTGASLLCLLKQQSILRGDYKLPTAVALSCLAKRISLLHSIYQLRKQNKGNEVEVYRAEAVAALFGLRVALPKIRDQYKSCLREIERLDLGDTQTAIGLRQQYEMLCVFGGHVKLFPDFMLGPFASRMPFIEGWKDYQIDIATKFADAVEIANPAKARLSFSNAGPIARFLHLIIPRVSDEAPMVAAIAQSLRRATRGDNQPSAVSPVTLSRANVTASRAARARRM